MKAEAIYDYIKSLSLQERGVLGEELERTVSYFSAVSSRRTGLAPKTAIDICFSDFNESLIPERRYTVKQLRAFLQYRFDLTPGQVIGI